MNLMKVGSGEMSFAVHPLADIARAAYDEVAGLIRAKGQQFELSLPEESITARVDAHKLTMALTNLLNNAMRFTPEEGHIGLALIRRGAEGWFRVDDTGLGIPGDELERIFDEFYQVENHMTRRHQGMGLGLSIVRAIAEAHGGRVWAESPGRDQGSAFTIAVPM
jgi:signal transduction histidine kinase